MSFISAVHKPPRLFTIEPGRFLYRIHKSHRDPLWFGPAPQSPALFRFDDPQSDYCVCYLGQTVEAAFAETFLRDPPVTVASRSVLEARTLSTVRVVRPLQLIMLFGPGLAALGVTADITTGAYVTSQALSRQLWERVPHVDGIAYASRHDNTEICVALFDRAREAIALDTARSLLDDPRRLATMLDQYNVALTP